jgi:RNA-directed DNA polymerase
MQTELSNAIRLEAQRRIAREQRRAWKRWIVRTQFLKHSGAAVARKAVRIQPAYRSSPHFDPHHCRRRSEYLASGLWKSILSGTYKPLPAYRFALRKQDGSKRHLNVFSIPDAAIAALLLRLLNKRLATRFSNSAYAYRRERNSQAAVADLARAARDAHRLFVVEIDFAKYFDSISHDYVKSLIASGGRFELSAPERHVIDAMLRYTYSTYSGQWPPPSAALQTNTSPGVAQGHSLSLFLANLAAAELDDELESLGVRFFRYADDIVVVARTYDSASAALEKILSHCTKAGLSVNRTKSPGIRLLSPLAHNEFPSTEQIDFLGYSVSLNSVSLKPTVLRRIKRRVAKIIYRHLISLPKRGFINRRRLSKRVRDFDLLVCLNRIRRYVYGRQSEADILASMTRRQRFKRRGGVVAYFPVVDCITPWKELDGWLVNALARAHRMRARLLAKHGVDLVPVSEADLLLGNWVDEIAKRKFKNMLALPSFVRAWRSCRREYLGNGLGAFPSCRYPYAYGK